MRRGLLQLTYKPPLAGQDKDASRDILFSFERALRPEVLSRVEEYVQEYLLNSAKRRLLRSLQGLFRIFIWSFAPIRVLSDVRKTKNIFHEQLGARRALESEIHSAGYNY